MTAALNTSRATAVKRVGSKAMLGRLALLIAICAFFALIAPSFLAPQNIYALLQSFALLGLVTLGLSLTMIAGEFDLSVGSMVAVGGLLTIKIADHGLAFGIGAAVLFGLAVGLINAFICVRLKVASLVVTVGSMMTLSGFAYWLANGEVVSSSDIDTALLIDNPIAVIFSLRSIVTFGAFLLVTLMMNVTRAGRDIIATGSRRDVAAASGVRLGLTLALVFGLSGCMAAFAGSLLSISLVTASATMGTGTMLQAASAALIGGVALSGGRGRPVGVMLGVMILAALNNGLGALGASAATILLSNGLVLLGVVLLDGSLVADLLKRRSTARSSFGAGLPKTANV